jgi:alpha-beta hydrolase superfamily lysophospholipase
MFRSVTRPTDVANPADDPGAPPTVGPPAPRRSLVRRPFTWARRRPGKAVLALLLFLFVLANLLAFVQAYSMTHFVHDVATTRLDQLSGMGKLGVILTGVSLGKPRNTISPQTFNLPYETHRYRGADGTEYEAWRIPAGGPPWRRWRGTRGVCLLFHGYAGCKAGVLREAEVVRRAGYDAFLVDFRGSGGSSGSVTTVGYREADDVAEAEKYVRQRFGPQRLVIYGRSMGAAAVLRAVSLGTARPDALVIESPFDRMLTTVSHRFDMLGVPKFPLAPLLVFWGGVQHGYWAFGHNPSEYARSVTCPTLMIRAGRDPFIRGGEAQSVFDNVPGPKALFVVDAAAHEPCIAVDKPRWTERVTDFLLKAPKGGAAPTPGAAVAQASGGAGRGTRR